MGLTGLGDGERKIGDRPRLNCPPARRERLPKLIVVCPHLLRRERLPKLIVVCPHLLGLQSIAEWGVKFLCVTQCFCQGVQKPGGVGAFRQG